MKASERMKLPRQRMREQVATVRARNFGEVNLGLCSQTARLEAERCLRCKNPKCVDGCPVGVDIPRFIAALADGDLPGAAEVLYASNMLPAITGRVCPQEKQCEARCVCGVKSAPVAVGYLERYVADWARENAAQHDTCLSPTGRRVAVVGAGPAGLTCAGELARQGHSVTVFEALHKPGGVLVYGIPEFRLPKNIVDFEVERLRGLGVRIECNVVIGRTYTIQDLLGKEGFNAVFIGNGAGLPVFQGIPGEELKGVYSANEYLTRVNLMEAFRFSASGTPIIGGRRVVVVGGGNTAMDAVRTARRLGAEQATLVYRRSRAEMPARAEEVKHAEEEGVEFQFLSNPLEILSNEDGWCRAVRCIHMELGPADQSGRRRPVPIEGSEFEIECDLVIEAIGTGANPLLTHATPELALNQYGYLAVDEKGMTSIPGVFAGGDIVRGAATVILAMGDGKSAAAAMHDYLSALTRRPLEVS